MHTRARAHTHRWALRRPKTKYIQRRERKREGWRKREAGREGEGDRETERGREEWREGDRGGGRGKGGREGGRVGRAKERERVYYEQQKKKSITKSSHTRQEFSNNK